MGKCILNRIDLNSAGKWAVYTSQTGSSWIALEDTITASLNTFYHLAFCKNGSNLLFYVNGILKASAINTNVWPNYTNPLYIGDNFAFTQPFNGYISEIRISNTARYTTNFTPSTRQFQPDPYTKLLLHMDGVGNAFYDSSDAPGDNGFPILPDGVTITPTGTFAVQKLKNGCNSLKFDGSTNYISLTDHASWDFAANEDFTISFWAKYITGPPYPTILGNCPGTAASAGWMTGIGYELRFWFAATTGSSSWNICNITSILSWTSGQWYHFAIVRKNGVITLYRDLTVTTSGSCSSAISSSNTLKIGYDGAQSSTFANNNIKGLMLFKRALTYDQLAAIRDETYIY